MNRGIGLKCDVLQRMDRLFDDLKTEKIEWSSASDTLFEYVDSSAVQDLQHQARDWMKKYLVTFSA